MTNLNAPGVVRQPVSVTRKMSASLPRLRKVAQDKGLKIHHLGAGYPHPEVTDPRGFIAHEAAYLEHLTELRRPERSRRVYLNTCARPFPMAIRLAR